LGIGSLGCDRLMKERKKVESMLASASAAVSAAEAAMPPPPAPATAAIATSTVSDAQIPAPEDFEEAAAKEITAANAQAEFDRLKKDIGP
jgi:hypothetical protein